MSINVVAECDEPGCENSVFLVDLNGQDWTDDDPSWYVDDPNWFFSDKRDLCPDHSAAAHLEREAEALRQAREREEILARALAKIAKGKPLSGNELAAYQTHEYRLAVARRTDEWKTDAALRDLRNLVSQCYRNAGLPPTAPPPDDWVIFVAESAFEDYRRWGLIDDDNHIWIDGARYRADRIGRGTDTKS